MAMSTAQVSVRKQPGGMEVLGEARGFEVTCDEPQDAGGTNTGMNPVEMLLAALGSCMTIAAYYLAPGYGIALEDFGVELEGDIDSDGFMGLNPDVRSGFSDVRLKVHVKSDAAPGKAAEFVEFVKGRCPVSDCLANGVPMSITEIDAN